MSWGSAGAAALMAALGLGCGADPAAGPPDAAAPDAPESPDACLGGAATRVAVGRAHTCVLRGDGGVACWGANSAGQLGLGDAERRGDDPGEMGDALPHVDLGAGRAATALAIGDAHTCALLDGGAVKCWGASSHGELGLGDTAARGGAPGEMGDALAPVNLGAGRAATAIAAGEWHTCALLDDGSVKCWGYNVAGQLGTGDVEGRGDDPGEMGDALPPIDLGAGRVATAIAAGWVHTCALLDDGAVKCWGGADTGQLGLGDTAPHGDLPGGMGDALPPVDLGAGRTAAAITAGTFHTCALLDDGSVKCWGLNGHGQLGLGDTDPRGGGPGEMGDALPPVNLGEGAPVLALSAGDEHTCAVREDGRVQCWGENAHGELGDGGFEHRGDDPGEMGGALPAVDLGEGGLAAAAAGGVYHSCALLEGGAVRCWGRNDAGELGRCGGR